MAGVCLGLRLRVVYGHWTTGIFLQGAEEAARRGEWSRAGQGGAVGPRVRRGPWEGPSESPMAGSCPYGA